jgi:hypothetical protein
MISTSIETLFTAPVLKLINSSFLSYIFTTYSLNPLVTSEFGRAIYFIVNFCLIYLILHITQACAIYFSPKPSSLPYALKGKSKQYPRVLDQWHIKIEAAGFILTFIFYFVILLLLEYVQLFITFSKSSISIIDLNPQRLLVAPFFIAVYMNFLFSAVIWQHDRQHHIKNKDSNYHQIATLLSLAILFLLIILF